MLPVTESFDSCLAWQRKWFFRSICWAWLDQPSARPWAVCSQHCLSPTLQSRELWLSTGTNICWLLSWRLRMPQTPQASLNGNQHCSNSTECWLLAAAENLSCKAACLILLEKAKTNSSYQVSFASISVAKSQFLHTQLCFWELLPTLIWANGATSEHFWLYTKDVPNSLFLDIKPA